MEHEKALELSRIYESIGESLWDPNTEPSEYIQKRLLSGYFSQGKQLDMLYWDVFSGKFGEEAKNSKWFIHCSGVKEDFPKPL